MQYITYSDIYFQSNLEWNPKEKLLISPHRDYLFPDPGGSVTLFANSQFAN